MGRRPKNKGNGQLPSAEMLIIKQMMEQQHQESMKALISQVEKQFKEFNNGLLRAQHNHLAMDQKLNVALQTIEIIKQGLEQKGILTQDDMTAIMTKQLEDQQAAREILGDDTLTEEEKIKQLQEKANLSEKETHGIIKAYNEAVAAAQEAGTSFIRADGGSDSEGDEEERPDGHGDPSRGESTQPRQTGPDLRIVEP